MLETPLKLTNPLQNFADTHIVINNPKQEMAPMQAEFNRLNNQLCNYRVMHIVNRRDVVRDQLLEKQKQLTLQEEKSARILHQIQAKRMYESSSVSCSQSSSTSPTSVEPPSKTRKLSSSSAICTPPPTPLTPTTSFFAMTTPISAASPPVPQKPTSSCKIVPSKRKFIKPSVTPVTTHSEQTEWPSEDEGAIEMMQEMEKNQDENRNQHDENEETSEEEEANNKPGADEPSQQDNKDEPPQKANE